MRNSIYPGHVVSWGFPPPDGEERVAILIPEATPRHVRIIACNLDRAPVKARMTAWDVEPDTWSLTQGTRADASEGPLDNAETRTVPLERTEGLDITFPPRTVTVIELKLVAKGTPYWSRPDLGISGEDVKVSGGTVEVTVHSLGAADAPPSRIVVRDRTGRTLATASVPGLKAPLDLLPKKATVRVSLPAGRDILGGSVTVETAGKVPEITRRNNEVRF